MSTEPTAVDAVSSDVAARDFRPHAAELRTLGHVKRHTKMVMNAARMLFGLIACGFLSGCAHGHVEPASQNVNQAQSGVEGCPILSLTRGQTRAKAPHVPRCFTQTRNHASMTVF